jgi:hypothetical protein
MISFKDFIKGKLKQKVAKPSVQDRLDKLIDSGKGYDGGTPEERKKRFDKFVEESNNEKLPHLNPENKDISHHMDELMTIYDYKQRQSKLKPHQAYRSADGNGKVGIKYK